MARTPKPLSLHITEGTYRADRHGSSDAVVDPAGVPVKPRGLKGEARKFWDRVVPGLVSSGVARECDTDALAALCHWYALWVRLSAELDATEDLPGSLAFTRLLAQAATCWSQFARLAAKFGLTPGDRMQLRVEVTGKTPGVMSRDRGAGKKAE